MISKASLTFLAFSLLTRVSAQCLPTNDIGWRHKPEVKDSRVSAKVIYNGLSHPRGIRFMQQNTLLVVDSGVGLLSFVENKDGCEGWTKSVIVENGDLNHGLAVNGTTIYASSVENVFRYTWDPNTQKVTNTETLVTGMNLAQNHKTRTLELDGPWLMVSGGASENLETESVDPARGTAQIRRFALNGTIPSGGYDWFSGEVVAWGMRNAVGIRLSQDRSKLWTVENSADDLTYTVNSQAIDVHLDNPAEEVNVVDLSDIGHYFGYPECFTAWNMGEVIPDSPLRIGDQFSIASNVTDAQCQNTTFNVPPVLSMQAHSAPLDIAFFDAANSNETIGIPRDYNSHAFVSFHGSWNREPAVGYGVVRIPWSDQNPQASRDSGDGYSFILQASDLSACPDNCFRPVGVEFDSQGRLFGSSDSTGELFVITNFTGGALGLKITFTTLVHMAMVGFATTFLLA